MMSNKIALISPRSCFFLKREDKNLILDNLTGFDVHQRYWSGLTSAFPILASLTPSEFEIEIIDENIEDIDYNKDYCMVAVTAMTQQAIRAYQICAEFRKRDIHTVIGGVHSSFETEEASLYADTVVIGEAENIWQILLSDLKNGTIKKSYDQKDYPPVDLTKVLIPRYDLLKNKNYKILWLNTSRGCPYDCEFCSVTNFFGKKMRNKTIDQICNEIEFVKKHFPRILIGFGDDNMFVNRKHAYQLLERFKELNFKWVAQTDISIGEDKEFLKSLFNAGCQTVFIGFESLDEKNLEEIYEVGNKLKKDFFARYEGMIENIQSNGIGIWGAFIIGLDNDTSQTFKTIVDFTEKANLLGAQITVLTPLPGTRLRKRLMEEKRLLPTSWENYTLQNINFIPKNISYQDIENGIIDSMKQIFSEERRLKVAKYFKDIYINLGKD